MRIKNRQVRGPYHLAKVLQIRSDRIDQTRTKWQATNREHVAFPLLHEESHDAGDRYQAKKRDLLPSQPQKISAESGSWLMTQPAERPKVQKQQHRRQSHKHRLAHQTQREQQQSKSVEDFGSWTPDFRFLAIARVGPERQHSEKRAQHILPLRDPRDRFHMKRMERKQRRDEGAAPEGSGHSLEDKEKQKRICRMKEHVRQMMIAGLQPKELAVQHV